MSVDRRDPEAVARAAASAMHEERWDDVATLCDAGALARWHDETAARRARSARAGDDAPADELLATDMRVDITVLLRAADGTWGIVPDDNLLGLRQ